MTACSRYRVNVNFANQLMVVYADDFVLVHKSSIYQSPSEVSPIGIVGYGIGFCDGGYQNPIFDLPCPQAGKVLDFRLMDGHGLLCIVAIWSKGECVFSRGAE